MGLHPFKGRPLSGPVVPEENFKEILLRQISGICIDILHLHAQIKCPDHLPLIPGLHPFQRIIHIIRFHGLQGILHRRPVHGITVGLRRHRRQQQHTHRQPKGRLPCQTFYRCHFHNCVNHNYRPFLFIRALIDEI